MIIACNCTECKNQIDKTVKVEGGIRVVLACKAFPNGIPHEYLNKVDSNTERECANGFHFVEREYPLLKIEKAPKKETIFDKVKKMIKR